MNVIFHPIADDEYWNQIDYYGKISESLGDRFEQSVDKVITGIVNNPYLCHNRGEGIFSVRLKGFPFSVFYRLNGKDIYILSICHERRDPNVWKFRK